MKYSTEMNEEKLSEEPVLTVQWAYKTSDIHEIKLFKGYIINLRVEDTQEFVYILA